MKAEPSIRRTLLVRCGVGIGALFVLLSVSVYFLVRQGLYGEMDDSLRETASILANQMEFENGEIIFEWEEGIGTNQGISEQSLFQYWNQKEGSTTRSPALGGDDLPEFSGPDGMPDIETVEVPGKVEHARAIGMTIYPYVLPEEDLEMKKNGIIFDPKLYPHTLVLARDLSPVLSILAQLATILTVGTLVILVIGFFLISRAIRSSLAPIGALTRTVRSRSGNALDAAIILPGNLPSELTPLAESFDELLGRVEAIRDREKDFIRHAAHELRTPIAALSSVTELALSKKRSAEEYAVHLQECAKTSEQLNGLVQRLAGLARIGKEAAPARREQIDVEELLAASLEDFTKNLSDANISLQLTPVEGCSTTMGDPVLVRLILNNLLDNAASYAPEGSTLRIDISSKKDGLEITFTNPATDLPEDPDRLFEPLFRRDTSRTDSGHSHLGIGLTLSRDAAQAMGGKLTATRADSESITFTLTLPTT